MSFSPLAKENALVRSRRCCCICHEFAGLYTNVHHIVQKADGGEDDIDNAIVLCLRCHGEVGHYNVRHPIGNKYSEDELRKHRDQWWAWCVEQPTIPMPKHPVAISPGKIMLTTENWRARSIVSIYNKSDDIWYQIAIKITTDSQLIMPSNIEIDLARPKPELQIGGTPLGATVDANLIRLDGVDESGQEASYLWLNSLDPREILKLKVLYRPTEDASRQEKVFAHASITAFEPVPPNILEQPDGKIAIPFQPSENFTAFRVSILMKNDL